MGLEKEFANRKTAEQKLKEERKKLKALASELSYAEERERRRIAREIHDDLAQKLAMIKFRLQALKGTVSDKKYV